MYAASHANTISLLSFSKGIKHFLRSEPKHEFLVGSGQKKIPATISNRKGNWNFQVIIYMLISKQ